MDYIPQDGQVKIYLKNAVPVESLSGTAETDGYTSYVVPVTVNDVEFPVLISEGDTKAYFKLTADSYEASAVAEANIQKLGFSNLKLINLGNNAADYVIGGRPARIDFTLDDMPSDNNAITISLDNLTLGSGMSGVSAVTDNHDGSYELVLTGTTVKLDVTPVFGATEATFSLTDDEFYDAECTAEVKKFIFRNLKINLNEGEETLATGESCTISFNVDFIPSDREVTVWIFDASVNDGTATDEVDEDGFKAYTVSVTSKTTVLSITASLEPDWEWTVFYLTDDEFEETYWLDYDGVSIE